MSREELLELAALDAFGLLDRYESALYNRSFHHASAAVQNEIRELQAMFTGDESLLPDVEPDPELRERVLRAVAKAIEADSERLAPLASIGRTQQPARESGGRRSLGLSGQFWRAATFVLAGALLVMIYFNVQQRAEYSVVRDYALGRLTDDQVSEQLGEGLMDFVRNKNSTSVVLRPMDNQSSMHAVLFLDEKTGKGFLYGLNLPERVQCSIHANDADSREVFRRSFESTNLFQGMELNDVSSAMLARVTWQIRDAATGAVLLSSA
jgi:hypothetical protein